MDRQLNVTTVEPGNFKLLMCIEYLLCLFEQLHNDTFMVEDWSVLKGRAGLGLGFQVAGRRKSSSSSRTFGLLHGCLVTLAKSGARVTLNFYRSRVT